MGIFDSCCTGCCCYLRTRYKRRTAARHGGRELEMTAVGAEAAEAGAAGGGAGGAGAGGGAAAGGGGGEERGGGLDAPPQRQLPPQRHQHKGLADGGGGSGSGGGADRRVGRDKLNMEQAPTRRPPPVPPPKPAHMLQHACRSPQVQEVESPFGTAAPPSQLADDSSEFRASIAPAKGGGEGTEQEKGVKDTAEASAQRDGVRGEKEATAHAHAVAGADGDWQSVVHAETGGTYYWNTKTNQTSWARPLALAGTSYCTGHSAAAATTHGTGVFGDTAATRGEIWDPFGASPTAAAGG